jgi:uncharacterized repeat protein (TIGR03837 family)
MQQRSWDIFCSVVDNFGDIGVCWRLARRLVSGLEHTVRLWVDDLASFHRLCPQIELAMPLQIIGGVEVRQWPQDFPDVTPADIVVEGFGARLPARFLDAMVARGPAPVWINLEYLSAESWVDSHHGLPSPHPRLPLTKHFYFPGFTAATGGVLIEDGLAAARSAFQSNRRAQIDFRRSIGIDAPDRDGRWLSLFCYENAALPGLVAAWAADRCGINCAVPAGYALAQIETIAGRTLAPGSSVAIGNLRVFALPFLAADRYDRLLWAGDLNFVRGEDSFVRAQLAARPLVWQAYPQDDDAHLAKAAAFWTRYAAGLEVTAASPYERLFADWNRQSKACGDHWAAIADGTAAMQANALAWAARLAENGDLAVNLAKFCEDRLE